MDLDSATVYHILTAVGGGGGVCTSPELVEWLCHSSPVARGSGLNGDPALSKSYIHILIPTARKPYLSCKRIVADVIKDLGMSSSWTIWWALNPVSVPSWGGCVCAECIDAGGGMWPTRQSTEVQRAPQNSRSPQKPVEASNRFSPKKLRRERGSAHARCFTLASEL